VGESTVNCTAATNSEKIYSMENANMNRSPLKIISWDSKNGQIKVLIMEKKLELYKTIRGHPYRMSALEGEGGSDRCRLGGSELNSDVRKHFPAFRVRRQYSPRITHKHESQQRYFVALKK
jgi:hypothetical protein